MKTRFIEGRGTTEDAWASHGLMAALPTMTAETIVPPGRRCVVVAPHPDDEVLPCGGLLAELEKRGRAVLIVAVTDGERSHHAGSQWTAERLRKTRPAETRRALRQLGLAAPRILRLRIPDGSVKSAGVEQGLRGVIQAEDIIFTTWALDGHPDHEATWAGVANAAQLVGASVVQMPIWGWHWAEPDDARLPWPAAVKFPVSAGILAQKQRAIAEFQSQLERDEDTGQPPILPPTALRRFIRTWETYFLPR